MPISHEWNHFSGFAFLDDAESALNAIYHMISCDRIAEEVHYQLVEMLISLFVKGYSGISWIL